MTNIKFWFKQGSTKGSFSERITLKDRGKINQLGKDEIPVNEAWAQAKKGIIKCLWQLPPPILMMIKERQASSFRLARCRYYSCSDTSSFRSVWCLFLSLIYMIGLDSKLRLLPPLSSQWQTYREWEADLPLAKQTRLMKAFPFGEIWPAGELQRAMEEDHPRASKDFSKTLDPFPRWEHPGTSWPLTRKLSLSKVVVRLTAIPVISSSLAFSCSIATKISRWSRYFCGEKSTRRFSLHTLGLGFPHYLKLCQQCNVAEIIRHLSS